MKHGKSIIELATEIQRQAELKRDLVASTEDMVLLPNGELYVGADNYDVTPHAHRQIAQRLDIPAKYYERMRQEAPELLADNVNHWFEENPERRMVRTLGGKARAFLSDRYRRIDNEDVAEAVLPVILDQTHLGNLDVLSCEVTDSRLYIQATFPRVAGEVKVGDVVQSGFIIRNSEIGLGAFSVDLMVYRLVCSNGMVAPGGLRKYHVGRRAEAMDGSYEVFSDETLKLDDAALMGKMRDLVLAFSRQEFFNQTLAQLQEAARGPQIVKPSRAIEVLAKRQGLSGAEGEGVLANLIRGGDLSRYGLLNAVTAMAHDAPDYDRSVEFEELGGKILNLSPSDWREISEAV